MPGYELTLAQAVERLAYCVSCHQCGHKARIDLQKLIERLGPQYRIGEIRSRLRCSKCGAGEQIILVLWRGTTSTPRMLEERGYPVWPGD